MRQDVIVVGAGVAGLSAARELALGGRSPVVLDKARGVGGRCATRRVDGQPVDHGTAFLHGSDREFLQALDSVESAGRLDGWPSRIHGTGAPCQPWSFTEGERRVAFSEGVTAFPKHIAQGLDVRTGKAVASLDGVGEDIEVRIADGEPLRTRDLVLAIPLEQARVLLEPLAARSGDARAVCRLLGMLGSVPSLALVAGYDRFVPAPGWDVCYPEDSGILQLVSHDSSKRAEASHLILVFQCLPRWSRARLEDAAESWTEDILAEAGRRLGPWAGKPVWTQAHRWRFARADQASGLARPVVLSLGESLRVGLAGEQFAPRGGVQAAWISGRRLARRLLGEENG